MVSVGKFRLLLLFAAASGVHGFPNLLTSFESLLVHCCGIGTAWGRNQTATTCTGPQWPIPQINVNDRMACATAIYICCIRFHRVANCDRGKHAAQTGQACSVLPISGGETYKDCCDGCSLGLKAGSLRMPCSASNIAFGTPWEQAYEDCCVNAATNPGTLPFSNSGLVGKTCEIDKPCAQICEDKGASVRCSCFPGFKLAADQRSCEDIDECLSGVCDPATELCFNTLGSYTCSPKRSELCPPGFKLNENTGRCIDVDECAEGIHQCDPELELCSNSINGYQCHAKTGGKDCPAGFKKSQLVPECEDVNECTEQPDICDSKDHECRNTIGGYECIHYCAEGMTFDELQEECVDIDECAESLHDCKPDETCQNESPSYRCISDVPKMPCPAGYKPTGTIDGAQESCVDVDECEEDLHSCAVSEVCVNEIGSYKCEPKEQDPEKVSCSPGTIFLDGRCEDIDECATNQHNCHKDWEFCVNNLGGFRCFPKPSCMAGFTFNIETKSCADIDECTERTDNCNRETHECVNEIGSYRCELRALPDCSPGYRRRNLGGICEDIDECAEQTDECNWRTHICVNEPGSYTCVRKTDIACFPGYRPRSVDGLCEDIDECAERLDNCIRATHDCLNEPGSYICRLRPIPECPPGYRRRGATGTCEDIDECVERLDNCNRETHDCINDLGTYTCNLKPIPECPHGYYRRTATGICEDVNECTDTERKHDCDKVRQQCVNTVGSYHCIPKPGPGRNVPQCGIGYRPDPNTGHCRDINECEEQRPCLADQTCENTPGSYQCLCRQGYTMDTIAKTCRDVNECQLGLHACADSQRCDNTVGSYTCVRTTSCGTGYTLHADTNKCEDDDECLLNTHNCGPDFLCRNTPGSFRCDRVRCPVGQRLLSDGSCQVIICNRGTELDAASGNCIDINECVTSSPCRKNQRCFNTYGSYRCQNLLNCGAGFELNEQGNHCVDIDECARRLHDCQGEQICRNRPGSYVCECPPGYSLNLQRQCEDIDECTRFRGQVCSVSSDCQNTPGSYTCNCKPGFKKAEDGKNCVDIDECTETSNICHQTCFNTWGSYKCLCHQGYRLAPDRRTCQDIDECSLFEGRGNLCIGFCVNEPGSYSCSCPDGYRLTSDKKTCQDIDECQEQDVCKGDSEVCFNTRGSFKCNAITCPPNYVRDRDHRNRCKRSSVECQVDDADCLKDPLSISYNYITFVSNMKIPPSGQLDLFTMRGPRYTFTTVQFNLDLKDARAGYGTVTATRQYFHLRRTAFNEAMVSLVKPIPGPQELELELTMKMYHNNLFQGTAIAKLYIFVSAHEF